MVEVFRKTDVTEVIIERVTVARVNEHIYLDIVLNNKLTF